MTTKPVPPKLLLVSVFGPYGVETEYDVGTGMQMELLNNQVTREQGIHSPRAKGTYSYGLYLIAENISVPTVVLDFPSWDDFVAELANEYTHVGISFIAQNILKARRMASYLREHYPDTVIIVGGAGADIPDLHDRVPFDEVCRGEGIRWMQRYFHEDDTKPLRRCVFSGPQEYRVYGARVRTISSSVFPGVGCPVGCEFCCTTHRFGKRYVPFIRTGAEMLDLLREEELKYGVEQFTIEDDNFLKHRRLARDLLAEMERERRAYRFFAFASADAIGALGVEFLVRAGIDFVWIGIESKEGNFGKLKNVDMKALIRELQRHGIRVLGSAILFLDHHDESTMMADVEWAVHLGADLMQFVALTPCPGTPLFERMRAENRLSENYPYHRQTGLGDLCYAHPHFASEGAGAYVKQAFRRNFEVNGPALLNLALTAVTGYRKVKEDCAGREREGLAWNGEALRYQASNGKPAPDAFMRLRLEQMRNTALEYRPLLVAMMCFAPNRAARKKCLRTARLYREVFGRPTVSERARAFGLLGLAIVEAIRIGVRRMLGRGELVLQPPTVRREFNGCDLR